MGKLWLRKIYEPRTKAFSHTLGACHEGAAIEGLCLSESRFDDIGPSRYPFYHIVSNSQNPAANAFDIPGTMIWILQTTEWAVPSAMHFFSQSDTNQQNMIFTPSVESTSYVSFDKAGRMYRQKDSNGDWIAPDTRNSSESSTRHESWYICLTHYNYAITSLVWVDGDAPIPQDSTCQSVGVQRLWV